MPDVYRPAEDSHLLAKSAARNIDRAELVLEIGVGSGYVADYIQDTTGANVIGTDINWAACQEANARDIPTVCANFGEPFNSDTFDTVVFNPPYLPTPPNSGWDDPLEDALSGGTDGRAVIRPFIQSIGRILHPGGRVFLLISSVTGIDEVIELATDAEFKTSEIAAEKYPFERLVVLELELL